LSLITTEDEEMGLAGFVKPFHSARHAGHHTLDDIECQ
jgi:hypothetical protein